MWVRIVEKARTRLSVHLLTTVIGNKGMPYQSCQSEYEFFLTDVDVFE
jgi:hypothetical protein